LRSIVALNRSAALGLDMVETGNWELDVHMSLRRMAGMSGPIRPENFTADMGLPIAAVGGHSRSK
jgi:hypothetical protein